MGYYINAISCSDALASEVNALIPDAGMRRRMSRFVRMGVATAMDCLAQAPGVGIDAIITATGLGCLADSEKFLRNIIDEDERLLNPTPFIQSTFNTVGASIALILGNHCYNMTYTHGGRSFESALIDAMIRIDMGAANVLVGAIDEATPLRHRIMERMGVWRRNSDGEGAMFTILSAEPGAACLGELVAVEFIGDENVERLMRRHTLDRRATHVMWDDAGPGTFHTASAMSFAKAVKMLGKGAGVMVRSSYLGQDPTLMILR